MSSERLCDKGLVSTRSFFGYSVVCKMSLVEEDWATWNFMQWFVKEQTEEETLALNLLDKIKIAGGEKASHSAPDDATLAQDITAENP